MDSQHIQHYNAFYVKQTSGACFLGAIPEKTQNGQDAVEAFVALNKLVPSIYCKMLQFSLGLTFLYTDETLVFFGAGQSDCAVVAINLDTGRKCNSTVMEQTRITVRERGMFIDHHGRLGM